MFLILDGDYFVFLHNDPTADGYVGKFESDVEILGGLEIYRQVDPEEFPSQVLGRSKDNPKTYRRFRNRETMESAGFEFIAQDQKEWVFNSWSDYLRQSGQQPS